MRDYYILINVIKENSSYFDTHKEGTMLLLSRVPFQYAENPA